MRDVSSCYTLHISIARLCAACGFRVSLHELIYLQGSPATLQASQLTTWALLQDVFPAFHMHLLMAQC